MTTILAITHKLLQASGSPNGLEKNVRRDNDVACFSIQLDLYIICCGAVFNVHPLWTWFHSRTQCYSEMLSSFEKPLATGAHIAPRLAQDLQHDLPVRSSATLYKSVYPSVTLSETISVASCFEEWLLDDRTHQRLQLSPILMTFSVERTFCLALN